MVKYWIWLSTRKGAGPGTICRVARHFTSAEEAYFADETAYRRIAGIRVPGSFLDKDLSDTERILRVCAEKESVSSPCRMLLIPSAC